MSDFFDGVTPQAVSEAEEGFKTFRIGENEAYIKMVQEKTAKNSGNPMLEITFATKDDAEIKHYIVKNEYQLTNIKKICIAFGIQFNDCTDLSKWLYKDGIVVCKEDVYNGNTYPKVSYFRQKIKAPPMQNNVQQSTQDRSLMESGYMTPNQTGYPAGQEFEDEIPF